jgi:hypothetical protein
MDCSRKTNIRQHLLIRFVALAIMLGACSPIPSGGGDTVVPQHASTRIAQRGETTWDLVALGDSTPACYGVSADHCYVQVYAKYVEQDLGINVAVHNWSTNSIRTVVDWVEIVRNNEELRDNLRNAQVITIWMGWHDLIPNIGVPLGGPCHPRAQEVNVDCLAEVTAPMELAFNDLLSEVVSLVSPVETLILIADVGIPPLFVAGWKEDGTFDIMRRYAYEVWRDYIIQAASRYGVHVVHTYEVFNGPSGDQGLSPEFMQSDNLHLNEQGHKLLADRHRQIGYEYIR